ncbi:hypothetical protein M7I_3843 [Glarea lozoyensis 74030]|uniref:Uncharacterized protein n=1 Tax=Glarea lozoyensis (strain ATCC 74030 / MF5533) TaxID=1104152 RepID=H0EMK5_GLAL7|nr:hypothetical protein M7I_3843 [Glarea lozoyensis 74030]
MPSIALNPPPFLPTQRTNTNPPRSINHLPNPLHLPFPPHPHPLNSFPLPPSLLLPLPPVLLLPFPPLQNLPLPPPLPLSNKPSNNTRIPENLYTLEYLSIRANPPILHPIYPFTNPIPHPIHTPARLNIHNRPHKKSRHAHPLLLPP